MKKILILGAGAVARPAVGYLFEKEGLEAAEQYGTPVKRLNGANIAGFVKVVDAIIDQSVV